MELIFEIVIETILELLLDTSIEGATTNKYPKLQLFNKITQTLDMSAMLILRGEYYVTQ